MKPVPTILRIAPVLALAAIVSACGKPTDAYLGRWQEIHDPARTLVIRQNGDEFLAKDVDDTPSALACKDLARNLFSGHVEECPDHHETTVVLTLSGEHLKNPQPAPFGLGISTVVLDRSSGELIVGSRRYKRIDE